MSKKIKEEKNTVDLKNQAQNEKNEKQQFK